MSSQRCMFSIKTKYLAAVEAHCYNNQIVLKLIENLGSKSTLEFVCTEDRETVIDLISDLKHEMKEDI
jgi:hypothetical protein